MKIISDTARVHLSLVTMEDAEGITTMANDEQIAHDIASDGEFPYPYKKSDAVDFVNSAEAARSEGTGMHFAIKLPGIGVIGVTGMKNIEMVDKKAEIGYWLGKEYRGKGYAREAVALLLSYCFGTFGLERIWAIAFAFNERSMKLLLDLGFTKEGTLRENAIKDGKRVDDIIFGMMSNEFKGSRKIEIKD